MVGNTLDSDELAEYRGKRRRQARTQFRIAGWVGLLGLGWLGLQLGAVGGNPTLPLVMTGTGVFFLLRGLTLSRSLK